jgi:hypothetical protein
MCDGALYATKNSLILACLHGTSKKCLSLPTFAHASNFELFDKRVLSERLAERLHEKKIMAGCVNRSIHIALAYRAILQKGKHAPGGKHKEK